MKQVMSESLWAPYGDALKLILAGSTHDSLTSDQSGIFINMLAQDMQDKAGNQIKYQSGDRPRFITAGCSRFKL